MTYTIKNLKNLPSDYGDRAEDGYRCTVYRDGLRLGTYTMPTNGGMYPIFEMKASDKTQLIAEAWKQTDEPFTEHADGLVVGIFLEGIIEEYEKQRQLKRWCKKSTVFTLKGDEDGSFRTIKAPYTTAVQNHILKKYGDRVQTILDEHAAYAYPATS